MFLPFRPLRNPAEAGASPSLTICRRFPPFHGQNEREKPVPRVAYCRRKTQVRRGRGRSRERFFSIRAVFSHSLGKDALFSAERNFHFCRENTFFLRLLRFHRPYVAGFSSRKRRDGLRGTRFFPLPDGETAAVPGCRFARRNALRACVFCFRWRGNPPSGVPFESGNPFPADIPSSGKGAGIAYFPRCPARRANTRFSRGRN